MALADVLRERVSRRGRTAQVECGELGTVTVEALPPRECSALGMADGGRALLYAACRELQAAGETLRRERRLFTPDEVTQYVSDKEARTAARTVLALSGVTLDGDEADNPDKGTDADKTDASDKDAPSEQDEGQSDKNSNNVYPDSQEHVDSDEAAGQTISTAALPAAVQNRREIVQLDSSSEVSEQAAAREKRLETVHETVQQMSEIRPGNVQFPEDAPEDGQVSREFSGDGKSVRATPSVVADLDFAPQNLALSEKNGDFMSPLELSEENEEVSGQMVEVLEIESGFGEPPHEIKSEFPEETAGTLHETESEVPVSLHEITSEFREEVHEIKSEVQETPHETKSEFAANGRQALHETESDFQNGLHETESDFQSAPHEIKSEIDENRREALHETTSELAEQVAELLLEGLRRAAMVR